ncbi:MAG: response regulator [Deltaproteobacteria bacterium]|jgi:signal transduction histidine kinase/CheY-like chemotaxis protein/HPt (histidine-containing phosphotransfer) domain-containing protein|nr:response regulator [Deltaproteobacteria bacterium]
MNSNRIKYRELMKENAAQLFIICLAFFIMMVISGLGMFKVLNENLSSTIRFYLNEAEKEIQWYLEEPEVAFKMVHSTVMTMLDEAEEEEDPFAGRAENQPQNYAAYLAKINAELTDPVSGIPGVLRVYGFIEGQLFNADDVYFRVHSIVQNTLWHQIGLSSLQPTFTSPYYEPLTNKLIITLCQNLVDEEGTSFGVLALDLDLELLTNYSKYISFREGSYSIIVNESRYILAHPDESKIFSYFNELDSEFNEIAELLSGGKKMVQSNFKNIYGVKSIIFFLKMNNNWIIGLIIPESTYYAGFYTSLGILLCCGTILMFSLCFLLLRVDFAKKRFETESRNKTSFLARISHEIRTPMNSIVGMSELLLRLEKELSDRALSYCRNIKSASDNLLIIINDILDFSKIETGNITIVEAQYSLTSLVGELVALTNVRMTEDSVVLAVDLDPHLPDLLIGDVLKIRQCLLNFLSNSIKYTRNGSINLDISGRREGQTFELIFSVKDTGIGVKRQDLDKLFHDFMRLDQDSNSRVEGTGLGLVITKRFCELMGGRIDVDSVYGSGSVFAMTLPQRIADPKPLAAVVDPASKRVLVFEKRRPLFRSLAHSLAALDVPHDLVTTSSRLDEKIAENEYTHIILPREQYLRCEVMLQIRQPKAEIALAVTELLPAGAGKRLSNLLSPIYSQPLAAFLNGELEPAAEQPGGNLSLSQGVPFVMPEAKILVVDDLETNLVVAEGLLDLYQVQTDLCQSGKEGVEMARQNDYDVIFMDHMMPGMDGIEAARLIRDSNKPDVPIIALTANAVYGMKEMFLNNGFNDFLAKPVDSAQLEEILENWIPKDKQKNPLDQIHDGTADAPDRQANEPAPHAPNRLAQMPLAPKTDSSLSSISSDVFPSVPNLNTNAGLANSAGKIDNYLRLLKVFVKDALSIGPDLTKRLENDDLTNYVIQIHALKSAAASIGAQSLSDLAKELEQAGKANDLSFVKDETPRFVAALSDMVASVEKLLADRLSATGKDRLSSTEKKGDEEDEGDAELLDPEVADKLEALKQAFSDVDVGAVSSFIEQLREVAKNKKTAEALEEIHNCFLEVEYEEAVEVIQALLDSAVGLDSSV